MALARPLPASRPRAARAARNSSRRSPAGPRAYLYGNRRAPAGYYRAVRPARPVILRPCDLSAGPSVVPADLLNLGEALLQDTDRALAQLDAAAAPFSGRGPATDRSGAWSVVRALPGVGAGDVDVEVAPPRRNGQHGVLTVDAGEGRSRATYALPPRADYERAEASLVDGVLRVSVPPAAPGEPMAVAVQAAGALEQPADGADSVRVSLPGVPTGRISVEVLARRLDVMVDGDAVATYRLPEGHGAVEATHALGVLQVAVGRGAPAEIPVSAAPSELHTEALLRVAVPGVSPEEVSVELRPDGTVRATLAGSGRRLGSAVLPSSRVVAGDLHASCKDGMLVVSTTAAAARGPEPIKVAVSAALPAGEPPAEGSGEQ